MSPITTLTTITLILLVVTMQATPATPATTSETTSSFMDYFRAPQRRNTKSMSFMDYFFPTFSRNPKTSDNLTNQTLSTSPPTSSTDEARATKTTKRKSSTNLSTNTTPKTTKKVSTSASSRLQESTTEKLATPEVAQRVTLADLAKVSESTATERSTLSTGETASTQPDGREGELELKEKSQINHKIKITDQTKKETVPLPAGSTSVLAKPTKYHYYPHNQHIYLLPECAIQQVCNAVYVRLNYTQPLCACPARHRDPCSASLNADDMHTTQLTTDSKKKYASKAVTLVKTCEAITEMRECRAPRDWSLLALQNIRTGKSHYLVICRCPEEFVLEGPMSHDQPTYASVPGIRVYGMMCVQPNQNQYSAGYSSATTRPTTNSYKGGYSQPHYNDDGSYTRYPGYIGPGVYYNRMARNIRSVKEDLPPFPWEKARELALTADWEN